MKTRVMVVVLAAMIGVSALAFAAGATVGARWGTYKGFEIVKVKVDGRYLESDPPAISVDGRTLAPVRALSEALGARVEWDAANQTVAVIPGGTGGATPPTTGQALPLTVGAKGFTPLATDSRVNVVPVAWGAEVRNPNTTQAAVDVAVVVAFKSPSGSVLTTEEMKIGYIPPGATALVSRRAGLTSCPVAPATMEVAALQGGWDEKGTAIPAFAFSGLAVSKGAYWGTVTGAITNPYATELANVPVNLVFYDAKGTVVGGEFVVVPHLPAGGTVAFTESTAADLPVATVRAYATVPAGIDPHQ